MFFGFDRVKELCKGVGDGYRRTAFDIVLASIPGMNTWFMGEEGVQSGKGSFAFFAEHIWRYQFTSTIA